MLVDSHCHLNFPQFEGKLEEVIREASEVGIGYMQTLCTKISEYEDVYKIANDHQNIFASVGIHPHEAGKESINFDDLKKLTEREKTIGIGETGLDYYYDHSDREAQKREFQTHLEVAGETGLPIIIHTRDAEDDTFEMLEKQMKIKPFKALLHCFTGTAEMAKRCMDLGLYISISGIVTFKNAKDLQETVRDIIPLDRLLVETDSPYLAPIPYRGKTNQPAYTRNTADFIAGLKEIDISVIEEHTTNNFFELFDKAVR